MTEREKREARHARLFILTGGLTGVPDVRPYTGPEGGVDVELLSSDVRLLIEECGLQPGRGVDEGGR